jgi:hypothetical protein
MARQIYLDYDWYDFGSTTMFFAKIRLPSLHICFLFDGSSVFALCGFVVLFQPIPGDACKTKLG